MCSIVLLEQYIFIVFLHLCKCVGCESVTSTVGKHKRHPGMLTVCTSWNASQCLYDSVYYLILSVSSDYFNMFSIIL